MEIGSLWFLLGVGLATVIVAVWLYRRWREVDDYYEREYKDPPVTDVTSWFGGGRGS